MDMTIHDHCGFRQDLRMRGIRKEEKMDNKSICNAVNKKDGSRSEAKYTEQQIRDAEAFLNNLKKIPDSDYEAARLLVLGFMTALDRKAK
jgi:hypothetical protein